MTKRLMQSALHYWIVIATIAVIWSADSALAADKAFACNATEVAAFPKKRIHVRCAPADGTIAYFALGVTDAGDANRVLSILSTAYAAKKKLTIWYDPADASGAAIGCQATNCRLIKGVRMFD